MAVRDIIEIDEELCDGCGDCVSACAEGAIQLVGGKAKLVRDSYCDGLGACLGQCPRGAITVIRREADGFDEAAVAAHLSRLAVGRRVPPPTLTVIGGPEAIGGGCPGSRVRDLSPRSPAASAAATETSSSLRHWPVQLHLVPADAPFFHGADVLLAADCVPFALASFHQRFLEGHSLAIACPKLDSHQDAYLEKLTAMIDHAGISSIHVVVMEVPCCGGLVRLVEQARRRAGRRVPVRCTVVGVDGTVRRELDLEHAV